MKKLIAIMLLIAIVISCFGCGKKTTEEAKSERVDLYSISTDDLWDAYYAEKNEGGKTPEDLYGMVDETTPVNGVYKIWSPKGVQQIADHPDASFEFLCSIDMEGATLRPIGTKDKPFTGNISGRNTILSNFTISESVDGAMGFLGYNQGTIKDLTLDEVTMVADENTKYIGGMAGYSEKVLRAVTVNGTITVDKAVEGVVCGPIAGYTNGDVINCASDMDITCTVAGTATIGGCVGVAENIRSEYTENYGFLDITGSNKTVGVIIGDAKNVQLATVAFLGEKNQVDGKLFTNYFGKEENVTYETLLLRDNTPYVMDPNVEKLRDTVVNYMYNMATFRWSVDEPLYYDCNCLLGSCHGQYDANLLHIGLPYKHYSSNMDRFLLCVDEDNYLQDWVCDLPAMEGYDIYVGNDCLGSIQSSWWSVSNDSNVTSIQNAQPARGVGGAIPIGDWPHEVDVPANKSSKILIDLVPLEVWFDAYAQVRKGDAYVMQDKEGSGHIRMAQENPVIVRDENGNINGDYSYIVTVEQGAPTQLVPYYTSWRHDYKYSFKNLALGGYCPITIEELQTGEMEPVEAKMDGGVEGKAGLTLGTIKTNYNISYVTMIIKDSQGNEVFKRYMTPNAYYYSDMGGYTMGIRNIALEFPMNKFAAPLQDAEFAIGESYTYSVSVKLTPGDEIVVHEGNFTHGNAG